MILKDLDFMKKMNQIKFIEVSKEEPYKIFKKLYDEALLKDQSCIDAVAISTYCIRKKEVDSRYVNMKFLYKKDFIFFTNYNSVKSEQINSHSQISALFYWPVTDTQIRVKGTVIKTNDNFSDNHFKSRSKLKNALALSSSQSSKIDSYEEVIKNYKKFVNESDLKKRPDYWGGFSLEPYYFEFWTGNDNRLNKREVYEKANNDWVFYYLQP